VIRPLLATACDFAKHDRAAVPKGPRTVSDTYNDPALQARPRPTHGRLHPFIAPRLQRGAEHLHRLGPHATAELLAEVAERIGGMPSVLGLLVEYERRFPTRMLRVVPR
jgi:hypothetical protein